MNTPKAIFIDMDGTLLSHKMSCIPKSAQDALFYAQEKGVLLFIATGRHLNELHQISDLDSLPLAGFVTLNGGYCVVDGEVIHKKPLHPETVRMVVERLAHDPFPCVFCEEVDLYINMINEHVEELQSILSLPLPDICDPLRALDAEIFQIAAFGRAKEEAFLRSLPGTKLTRWMDGGFDLANEDVNKWEGILHVLRHCGIAPHEAAAIGDAENDMEMLKNAGYSVAMGNADDDVKKCAGFVTRHVDNDGLAKAIEHLLGGNI